MLVEGDLGCAKMDIFNAEHTSLTNSTLCEL